MNNVIEDLVQDLKPVKKLWRPQTRAFIFFIVQLVFVTALMVWRQPFREGWQEEVLHHPHFGLQLLFFAFSCFSLGFFALASIIPGRVKRKHLYIALIPFALLLLSLLVSLAIPATNVSMLGKRFRCDLEVIVMGVIPFLHIIYLVRKGFLIFSLNTLLTASAASLLISGGLMHVACMYDPLHVLLFHIGPVFVGAILFTAITYFFTQKKNI